MNNKKFVFTDATIYEPDCLHCSGAIAEKFNVHISDETCWFLLDKCLGKLPLRKIYELLDDLYSSDELKFPEGCEFAVESIRARSVNKGVVYYYVKWAGWPPVFNTWEPESNLDGCKELIESFMQTHGTAIGMLPAEPQGDKKSQIQEVIDRLKEAVECSDSSPLYLLERFMAVNSIHQDSPRPYKQPQYLHLERQLSSHDLGATVQTIQLKRPAIEADFIPVTSKRVRLSKKDKLTLESILIAFQQKLNTVYPNEAPITVENNRDSECPPVDFQPIPDYLPGHGVFLPTKAPVGCECCLSAMQSVSSSDTSDAESQIRYPCWENRRRGCCAVRAGAGIPYNKQKRLIAPPGHPVYECNSTCPCDSSCPFRVVQLGRRVPLCVFRTRDRGWGVKTTVPIAKGTFVVEYLGEILTFEEAEKRGLIYDKQTMTYLFDLDFEGDAHYTVDASQMGNISHFINHSCDPNLTVRCVFIECLNTKLPRIALYASRFIRKGEELTFDYNMTGAIVTEEDRVSSSEIHEDGLPDLHSFNRPKSPTSSGSSSSVDVAQDSSSEVSFDSRSLGSKGPRMKCLCRSKNCRGYLVN